MLSFTDIKNRNLAFIIKKAGLPIQYNGYNSYGIIRNEPTDVLQMSSKNYAVKDTELTLTIQTNSVGILTNNTNIEVDGLTYELRQPFILGDGLQTKMKLTLVENV